MLLFGLKSTKLMKNYFQVAPSLPFKKAKETAKIKEGVYQQTEIIMNYSNTQTGSINNIQRLRKIMIQPNRKSYRKGHNRVGLITTKHGHESYNKQ